MKSFDEFKKDLSEMDRTLTGPGLVGAGISYVVAGAGGYGQPILTGIRLDDIGLILSGAVPAAVLALLAQGCFELCERYMTPKGLT